MNIEQELQKILDEPNRDAKFERQMSDFRKFEQRLNESGFVVSRKTFTIPLMQRLSHGGH